MGPAGEGMGVFEYQKPSHLFKDYITAMCKPKSSHQMASANWHHRIDWKTLQLSGKLCVGQSLVAARHNEGEFSLLVSAPGGAELTRQLLRLRAQLCRQRKNRSVVSTLLKGEICSDLPPQRIPTFKQACYSNRWKPMLQTPIFSITKVRLDYVSNRQFFSSKCKLTNRIDDHWTSSQSSEDTHFTGYARFEKVWAG